MTGYSLMNAGFEDPMVQGVKAVKAAIFNSNLF